MPSAPKPSAAEIEQWLVARLAVLLKVPADQVDVNCTFDRLGLDSATAVGITLDLEDWLGETVDPDALYDHPTVQRMAAFLAGDPPQANTPVTDNDTSPSDGAGGS